MHRFLSVALALALAGPALAADKPPAESKSFGSKEPDLSSRPPKKKKETPPTPGQLQYRLIRTAKSAFMGAVSACTRPDMCDPKSPSRDPEAVALVEKTERSFVDACEACATVEACEEERVKIRERTASFNRNPCMAAAAADAQKGSKDGKGAKAAPDAAKDGKEAKASKPAADAPKDAKGDKAK
jgi:hypothetical protein